MKIGFFQKVIQLYFDFVKPKLLKTKYRFDINITKYCYSKLSTHINMPSECRIAE